MLKQILKDESLKEKYWKGVNIDNENNILKRDQVKMMNRSTMYRLSSNSH